ncbi:MAG: TetR/AcrR family transcriptional regulator [Candidatus Caenarcaniphilales bacterium]|jgi:AcrR family transcriptional regulator|nr:TetR/AcrR family transcriptional regulator [Candidatus Caenarcaniphilales bacterium]
MPRRGEHSRSELEQLILNSANELLEKEGLAAVTTRKIAAKINYTHGTVHNFYEDFPELILRLNEQTLDQIYCVLSSLSLNKKYLEKSLNELCEAYLNYSLLNYNRWHALYDFSYTQSTKKELPEWYQVKVDKIFKLLELNFKNFGLKNSDALSASQILWSCLHGIMVLSLNDKLSLSKAKSVEKLIHKYTQLLACGLEKLVS